MNYVCLVYRDEKTVDAMPRGEFAAFVVEHRAYADALRKSLVASKIPVARLGSIEIRPTREAEPP